jgi:hypothetical protein
MTEQITLITTGVNFTSKARLNQLMISLAEKTSLNQGHYFFKKKYNIEL